MNEDYKEDVKAVTAIVLTIAATIYAFMQDWLPLFMADSVTVGALIFNALVVVGIFMVIAVIVLVAVEVTSGIIIGAKRGMKEKAE